MTAKGKRFRWNEETYDTPRELEQAVESVVADYLCDIDAGSASDTEDDDETYVFVIDVRMEKASDRTLPPLNPKQEG